MRGAITFLVLLASGVAAVSVCALIVGGSVIAAGLGCIAGAVATIVASIIVNTRNANRYGRKVWEDLDCSDFEETTARQPESPWGDCQRGGYHVAGPRLDRVRPCAVGGAAHSQSSTDPEARNHVR